MAAFQAMGTSPERRDGLKRLEISLALIRAATLKKEGSKTYDPDDFLGSSFRSSCSTSDSVTECREKLCSGAGEKEGEASGTVALERVGDEEMLDRQGGMAESNRNPDLMKWRLKSSAMCFLSVTTTSSTLRDIGSCEEEGLFSRFLIVFQNFLRLDPQRENCYLK
jgi:hypothetical protein